MNPFDGAAHWKKNRDEEEQMRRAAERRQRDMEQQRRVMEDRMRINPVNDPFKPFDP